MTLRTRLSIANLALLALILSAFGTGVYAYVDSQLHEGFESSLRNTAQHLDLLVATVRSDNQSEARTQVKATLSGVKLPETLAWAVETAPQEAILFKSDTVPQDASPPQLPHDRVVVGEAGEAIQRSQSGTGTSKLAFYALPFELKRPVTAMERRGDANAVEQRQQTVIKGVLTVARPVDVVEGPLRLLRTILIGGGLLALLAAALLGFGVSSALLLPLERMRAAAQRIGGERNFHLRFPVGNRRHELGRLAVTMNQMLDELEQAHGSLKATLEAQRRFVADASHELRTPVTAIRTNVEFLERAPNARAADRAEALADVLAEVRRMERLVGDLLALARLEAAAVHVHHPLRLDHLLGDVHRDAVRQAPPGVEVTLAPMPEVWVAGDQEDLRRALWNLAENALKYLETGKGTAGDAAGALPVAGDGLAGGRRGSVRLGLALVDGTAVVKVSDTGIGIAPSDRPYVFDRFWRAQAVRGCSGSGLGLAITRWVAQAHGGSVEVDSTLGAGSTFTMRLPAIAAQGARPGPETAADRPGVPGRRVPEPAAPGPAGTGKG